MRTELDDLVTTIDLVGIAVSNDTLTWTWSRGEPRLAAVVGP